MSDSGTLSDRRRLLTSMRALYGERERDPKIHKDFTDTVVWPAGLKQRTRLFVYDKCEPSAPAAGLEAGLGGPEGAGDLLADPSFAAQYKDVLLARVPDSTD